MPRPDRVEMNLINRIREALSLAFRYHRILAVFLLEEPASSPNRIKLAKEHMVPTSSPGEVQSKLSASIPG